MKDMKMKTKLILGFAVPILLTIITVLLGVFITKYAVSTISTMNEEGAQGISEGLERRRRHGNQ